ncbi:COR domain-containing protein [Anabaena cylindrica UHCC 0172]|uniref:COR domain-containing protein n=1 Tax=Anabaena cylindrica TaxID=1165 RepID=UPI002B21C5E0|nr:COR domain-containing protein [Anabaena cylindrica]MEA5551372.1 COR domain-containing protein [Anabaena cylindrica UHCC 0172]
MSDQELLEIIQKAAKDKATKLNLSRKGLTALPAEIAQLTNLSELDLSGNQLTTLPVEIAQLTNLSQLDLRNNQLTTLPVEIAQLTKLSLLYLRNNQLTTFPEAIAQLTKLSLLYLKNNQLTTFPEAIAQLINISQLDLSYNQLTTLPEAIAQLTNISLLDLRNNQLKTLPEAIVQLTNLSQLYLRNNQLTTFPEAITQLTKLSQLYLSNNQLTTLPVEIAQLTNLSQLYLRNNQLKTLPEAIAQLTNLSLLDLSYNQLTTLPVGIKQLSKLETLDLRGNKLNIPEEILGISWDKLGEPSKILSYYFSLQTEEQKPLNEAKVLLVGQGTVGKTSLVKRLIENKFDANERKTEGINIQNWDIEVNHQTIRLNIWDFGGQEIMHATHQFFLTKRSLYLLVINAREDEQQNRIEYWLKIIESFGGDSPIILVGNKTDEHPLDIDQKGLRDKYKNIKEILSISCKTGNGVDKLLAVIKREINKLEGIHDPLPLSWFEVKTCLEEMNKNYIDYSEYETICRREKITEELKQSTLIELLHQLGIILNFRDDPRVQDTSVLHPEWVTIGVYKILNDNLLMTQFRGILQRQQLQRILDCPEYPRNKQQFIIEMMGKFELCFPLEDRDSYLIPDLLPKQEPATGDWENILAFQYHYNVLPNSIISRFIVRMHHTADKQTWWRTGIVLKYRNSRALIKSDQEDRKIFISITGDISTRKELLAMIRSQFDAIHQTFTGLDPKEKVPIPGHPHIFVDYENLLVYADENLRIIPAGLKEAFNAIELLNGIESEQERHRRRDRERIEAPKRAKDPDMNPQPSETPPKQPISSAERGIALAMALGVLTTFIVLVLNPRTMNGNALAILRFLASAFAGISGYLVSGDLGLESSIPFLKTKTQVKATGAFAAFVLVFLLFYMGVPPSETTPQQTPTSTP